MGSDLWWGIHLYCQLGRPGEDPTWALCSLVQGILGSRSELDPGPRLSA